MTCIVLAWLVTIACAIEVGIIIGGRLAGRVDHHHHKGPS